MLFEIDEWTIVSEENLWLVYPTEEGSLSCNFKYFSSEREAVDFAQTYYPYILE